MKISLYYIFFILAKEQFLHFIINIIALIKRLEYFPILYMPPLMDSSFPSPQFFCLFPLLLNEKLLKFFILLELV